MHLRSGSRLGIGKAPSLVTTQGSETHPRTALNEQEIEGNYSSSSEMESMSGSGDIGRGSLTLFTLVHVEARLAQQP